MAKTRRRAVEGPLLCGDVRLNLARSLEPAQARFLDSLRCESCMSGYDARCFCTRQSVFDTTSLIVPRLVQIDQEQVSHACSSRGHPCRHGQARAEPPDCIWPYLITPVILIARPRIPYRI